MSGRKQSALVLFSGGMDSTIALYYRLQLAAQHGGEVHTLTFDYGQKHRSEVSAAFSIITHLRTDERYRHVLGENLVRTLSFPAVGSLVGTLPIDQYKNLSHAKEAGDKDTAFVPMRNLVMLSIAGAFAYGLGVDTIVTGLRGGFPDCTEMFEKAVQMTMRMAVPDWPVTITTPTHVSRAECLKLARRIPGCLDALGLSLTCFKGMHPGCGHCLPCLKRAEGFAAIGISDPAVDMTE